MATDITTPSDAAVASQSQAVFDTATLTTSAQALRTTGAGTFKDHEIRAPQKRMKLVRMDGDDVNVNFTNDSIVAHYNPEEFSEELSAEYQDQMLVGLASQRVQFLYGHPRKWTMNLLFNEWGDDPDRKSPEWKPVEDSLAWLRSMMLPATAIGRTQVWAGRTTTQTADPKNRPPPVLAVLLTKTLILAHITGLNITHKKLDPDDLHVVRATVDVTFTEFFPSNI